MFSREIMEVWVVFFLPWQKRWLGFLRLCFGDVFYALYCDSLFWAFYLFLHTSYERPLLNIEVTVALERFNWPIFLVSSYLIRFKLCVVVSTWKVSHTFTSHDFGTYLRLMFCSMLASFKKRKKFFSLRMYMMITGIELWHSIRVFLALVRSSSFFSVWNTMKYKKEGKARN